MHLRRGLFVITLLAVLGGCLEPYQPQEVTNVQPILVIDGFINATDNLATVKLSYSTALSSDEPSATIADASVIIEEMDGMSYDLLGDGAGTYKLNDLNVDFEKKYRLHVYTNNDGEYISDYITITHTPPIDSVTWMGKDEMLMLFVNTHDVSNEAQYYRWNYVETWEYISSFFSNYKMVDGEALERPIDERIYVCWSEVPSTAILIGSTVRLSNATIRDFPITSVPGNSVKISKRYSILVEQTTLTKEAYDFWYQLQKTTESLGGLFDPLPAQVLGNIRSPNSPDPVLGYFSGGEVSKQRIFIPFQDLPDELLRLKLRAPCQEEDIKSIPIKDIPTTSNGVYLIDAIYVPGVGIVGYTTAIQRCIDCRSQGGTTKQPDYW